MAKATKRPIAALGSTGEELLSAARFAVPGPSPLHVHRPRLLASWAQAETRPLALVSSPAGTGKTSLVAEWARREAGRHSGPLGWIGFEEGDDGFWGYVLDCLSRLGLDVPAPAAGASVDLLLGRDRLIAVATALAESPHRWTVVLDGYEMVSLDVAQEVDFLLGHTFGHLRLVFVGRVDPVLPLYRYRLRDDLLEIRLADLAFTDDEASQLLKRAGVRLGDEAVHELNQRVSGWAAGLHFAAQAMTGRDDAERSVAVTLAQSGDINEYLLGEVLDVQAPGARQFLLDTCVADVLSPGLVEELAGPTALHTLAVLAKSNVFLEPVPDEEPGSYRYYPFFRDMLLARLAYEDPQALVDLHRRAARWCRAAGLPVRSITHLAAVSAWDDVTAQVVEGLMVGRLLLEGEGGPLCRVVAQLPDDLAGAATWVVRAAVRLAQGDSAACAEQLSSARRSVGADAAGDEALGLSIAVVDVGRASLDDDAEEAVRLAEEAGDLLVRSRPSTRASRAAGEVEASLQLSRGLAQLRCGDGEGAMRALTSAQANSAATPFPGFRARCLGYKALLDAMQGRLSRARRAAEKSLRLAADAGLRPESAPAAAYVALARVAFDRYELRSARDHIASARALRTVDHDPITWGVMEEVRAGLERASGQLQPALARLAGAAATAEPRDSWLADDIRVEAARLSLASGRPDLALDELEPVAHSDRPDVAATVASARAELGEDVILTGAGAPSLDKKSSLHADVTRLLVEAVAESRREPPGRSLVVLDRALRLAAPEVLRRPFLESGPSVQRLLSADPRLVVEHRWLTGPAPPAGHPAHVQRSVTEPPLDEPGPVVESLTAKELEVLGHLEELLTTEEIAEKMFVSVNTVRTHVRSVLRKLGVNRRNAAVRRARELGLVTH